MRFWTKVAVTLFALPLMATGALAQTADPSPERLALARRLLDASQPPETEAVNTRLYASLMRTNLWMTIAFSGGAPEFDENRLRESLAVGAALGGSQSRELVVNAYAREMTDDELQGIIAFYDSPEGRAEVAASRQYLVQAVILMESDDPSQMKHLAPHVPSSAAEVFNNSPAGQAMIRANASEAVKNAGIDMAQNQIAAAQADYCAKAACGPDHIEMFRRMSATVAPHRYRGEHAMWGMTAGDLFTDSKVATLARAACAGDAEGVAAAVRDGVDPNTIGGEGTGPGAVRQRVTPLLWTIDCGSVDGVEALLLAGADPNQREEFDSTPVTVAAALSDPAILQALLSHGGDANAHDDRETALRIAMRQASWMERTDEVTGAEAWANWNALLAAGADPDSTAPDGRPLIEEAAMDNEWQVVAWLLERGWAGDAVSLGRWLEYTEDQRSSPGSMPLPSDTQAAMGSVKAELIRRGVRFPIGALADLSQDERGFYVQR